MKNMLHLSDIENPELVHIMTIDINHAALLDYPEYAGKLKKILQINFQNVLEYPTMQCSHWHRIDNHFRQAIELGFKYAVFWYDGTWPKGGEFEEELISQIAEWNKTRWLAAGHIINRKDSQPKWHPQCVVVNLAVFGELSIDDMQDYHKPYPAFCSSAENMHDDYTPLWLSGPNHCGGQNVTNMQHATKYKVTNNFLDVLFPHAFENNCFIHNLPQAVRDQKDCCYPEDDIEETIAWLFDYEFNTRQSLSEAKEVGYKLSEDKRELFQYKLMDSHNIYITNTESVPKINQLGAEVMVVPCAGLHQFKHMSNSASTLKRVVWTDFSKFGLAWVKKLLIQWDGVNFKDFYYNNRHVLMDMGFPHEDFMIFNEALVDEFIESYGGEEKWLVQWDWIRSLQHEFIEVDLVKDWPKVIDAVGNNHCIFVQLSNIWQYEINYLNSSIVDAELAFGNIIKNLMINNNTVYFTGNTPSGLHCQYKDLRSLPGII